MNFAEAIKMGSYGAYVWSCYGLTLLALVWLAIGTQRDWRNELKHARRRAMSNLTKDQPQVPS